MSLLVAAAMLASQAAVVPPPPGLFFGFYRILGFQQRAKELGCGTADLDRDLEEIRKQLVKRYGRNGLFPPKQPPSGMPGDCGMAVSLYRLNLADFRKQAAAALSAPVPGSSPPTR